MHQRLLTWGILTLLLGVALFNLFYALREASIVSFDEARHGISALEMLASGNYVANTYFGQYDYWNLKPPLAFYPMLAGFKLFGPTPLGLRFFSAVATLLTAGMLFWAGKRHSGVYTGILAVAILLTTRMFIAHHNARAGDADALFILLATCAVVVVLDLRPSLKHYCAACFLASLAFLTKSFHAGPFCLAIALFYFMDHGMRPKALVRGILPFLFFAVPVLAWMVLRYHHDGTSFFIHMLGYDAVERLGGAVEGHSGKPSFTIKFLLSDFRPWLQLAAVALCLMGILKMRSTALPSIQAAFVYKLILATALPLLLYTLSPTKLRWYAFCVYPFLSLLLAYLLTVLLHMVSHNSRMFLGVCGAIALVFCLAQANTVEAIFARMQRFHDPLQDEMLAVAKEYPKGVAFFLEEGDWDQSHVLVGLFAGNTTLHSGNSAAYDACEGNKAIFNKRDIR